MLDIILSILILLAFSMNVAKQSLINYSEYIPLVFCVDDTAQPRKQSFNDELFGPSKSTVLSIIITILLIILIMFFQVTH